MALPCIDAALAVVHCSGLWEQTSAASMHGHCIARMRRCGDLQILPRCRKDQEVALEATAQLHNIDTMKACWVTATDCDDFSELPAAGSVQNDGSSLVPVPLCATTSVRETGGWRLRLLS